jgi:mono/diheme cytochrome c family protein
MGACEKNNQAASVVAGCLLLLLIAAAHPARAQGDVKRGQYVATAAGCIGCHTEKTDGATPFAGGRALKTAFGTFYGPNITPHPTAGIGAWKDTDFVRAMRQGERPDGSHYFPAFPYPSFAGMAEADLRDLWAYLRSLPPDPRKNVAHQLSFLYSWRPLVGPWKWLFFRPADAPQTAPTAPVERGAYLVQTLGHCGECHTPRNFLGGAVRDRSLAGGQGPEGKKIPNLTPTRLKSWTDADLKEFFLTGSLPDGDSANETMAEVVRNTTSHLTPQDIAAIIAYLRSVPPLPEEQKAK